MTNSVFQGRSFLAEKDFTRAELEYLIGLSAHLKDLKKRNIQHHYLAGKNIALLFEKHLLVLVQPLQLRLSTLVLTQNTSEQMIFSWVKKNLLKILLKYWDVCLTGLNSADSANVWLKNWQNSQAFQYGTV
ncbi:ornithine carbamoyltransferase [Streptococcus pneumoniae]|nr:ornithine carbamoyltransferase [Streptococcus pneumoniae]